MSDSAIPCRWRLVARAAIRLGSYRNARRNLRAELLFAGLRRPAEAWPQDRDDPARRQVEQVHAWADGVDHGRIPSLLAPEDLLGRVSELSPRDIEHDNPEFRRLDETVHFLEQIYGRKIAPEDIVTVIRFSRIIEPPGPGFGNGEPPSPN